MQILVSQYSLQKRIVLFVAILVAAGFMYMITSVQPRSRNFIKSAELLAEIICRNYYGDRWKFVDSIDLSHDYISITKSAENLIVFSFRGVNHKIKILNNLQNSTSAYWYHGPNMNFDANLTDISLKFIENTSVLAPHSYGRGICSHYYSTFLGNTVGDDIIFVYDASGNIIFETTRLRR